MCILPSLTMLNERKMVLTGAQVLIVDVVAWPQHCFSLLGQTINISFTRVALNAVAGSCKLFVASKANQLQMVRGGNSN